MKPYVGVPYVYISRDRDKLDKFLSGDRAHPEDVLKLSTGDKSFLSFTSEFRFENSDSKAIKAVLKLVDTDRSFEYFFLSDALKIDASYGVVYHVAFGMGRDFSPIHSMILIGLVHRDDNNGLRKIILEFVTGPEHSQYSKELGTYTIKSEAKHLSLKTAVMDKVRDRPIEPRKGGYGRELVDLNYFYEQCLIKVAATTITQPVIILMPDIYLHTQADMGEIFSRKWYTDWILDYSLVYRRHTRVLPYINDFYGRLGFTLRDKPIIVNNNKGFLETDEENKDEFWEAFIARELIEDQTLDEIVFELFKRINKYSDYPFTKEMVWISDPEIINILRSAKSDGLQRQRHLHNPEFMFPSLQDENITEILVIGDKNTINSVLYGAASNIATTKITDPVPGEEGDQTETINIPLALGAYRNVKLKGYKNSLLKELWKHNNKLLRSHKESPLNDVFFSDTAVIKKYIKSAISGFKDKTDDHIIDEIVDNIPMFKYNIKGSNILSMTLQKDNQFFADLLSIYMDLEKLEKDMSEIIPYDSLLSSMPSIKNNDVPLSGTALQKKVIELYSLAHYNNQMFLMNVRTLPLFTFSTPSIVGTGAVGIIGNGLKVMGEYNQEPTVLDRLYSGLWNIFGYKHVIERNKVYSEFTLIRKNAGLFNTDYIKSLTKEEVIAKNQ